MGGANVGFRCPTRFVEATAFTTVDHAEAVCSGPNFRIGAAEIRMLRMTVASAKTTTENAHLSFGFSRA
jgi:hypothetical protein